MIRIWPQSNESCAAWDFGRHTVLPRSPVRSNGLRYFDEMFGSSYA